MRALSARTVAYEALGELIPFYPVYAVLFADHGASTAQISSLFVLWSVVGLVAEVPSGVLADVTSRRLVLVLAALVQGAGFATWTVAAGYPAFALGFLLWGVGGALMSGAYEAYVHDSLAVRGAVARYPAVIARGRALGLVCALAATVSAGPLLALGGFPAVGLASVAACLVQAAVAATLPADVRPRAGRGGDDGDDDDDNDDGDGNGDDGEPASPLAVLRAGFAALHGNLRVRHAVVVAAVLPGFLVFDEYVGLLAEDLGAARSSLPILVAVVVAAQALGALAGGRCGRAAAAPAVAAAGVLVGGGVLLGVPAGVPAIAVGYGLAQMAIVVAETRLQAVLDGGSRATATSFAGLLTEIVGIAVYASVGVAAGLWPLSAALVLLSALLLPAAFFTRRWLP